jgi:hypothetical protein
VWSPPRPNEDVRGVCKVDPRAYPSGVCCCSTRPTDARPAAMDQGTPPGSVQHTQYDQYEEKTVSLLADVEGADGYGETGADWCRSRWRGVQRRSRWVGGRRPSHSEPARHEPSCSKCRPALRVWGRLLRGSSGSAMRVSPAVAGASPAVGGEPALNRVRGERRRGQNRLDANLACGLTHDGRT